MKEKQRNVKSKNFAFRMDLAMFEKLSKSAQKSGLTVSQFIRLAVIEKIDSPTYQQLKDLVLFIKNEAKKSE